MTTLYHYCPTASFHAIVQSRAIWLSSLTLSNDSMEGKIVANTIARLAEKDKLSPSDTLQLQETIVQWEKFVDGLGFCLSEHGDLLSQWRGYAADGAGVAIGFSTEYFSWLAETIRVRKRGMGFSLQKIEYELFEHEACVEPVYKELKKYIDDGALKKQGVVSLLVQGKTEEQILRERMVQAHAMRKFSDASRPLIFDLYRLKSQAFKEEGESRLLSYFMEGDEGSCSYRTLHDRIIPYREFALEELERSPITEVILGPKHSTPPEVVQDFLKRQGFGAVPVRRSSASYR